ncbi:MAG: type IV secretory system conjugative DNA transfer family protein [Alphaproteobacteria bacterium]
MQPPNGMPQRIYRRDPYVHGSAEWATAQHLKERHYGEDGRLPLGYLPAEHIKTKQTLIATSIKAHILQIGATRSGKGISGSVPICLTHMGSMVCAAPKDGEQAEIAAVYRRDVLGHLTCLIDPEDRVASRRGFNCSGFNPLIHLDPKSPDFFDDAMLIGEAIVETNDKDKFWSNEAKALIAGLCMHIRTCPQSLLPNPRGARDLGQVRDCLNLPPKQFKELISGAFSKEEEDGKEKIILVTPGMAQSRNRFVRAAAGRIQNKAAKELSGVISTAQVNTHFLESPRNRTVLSKNDYHPDMLANGNTSVFLIISTAKISTDNRLVRLFVSWSLRCVSRFETKPNPPVLFQLEEMGTSLGYLREVEIAVGLMAGYGLVLHMIIQDLSQLKSLYPSWETFIANCGVIQVSGVNDLFTAEYLSKLCGTTTIESLSEVSAAMRAGLFTDPEYTSSLDHYVSRPLITPDEFRSLHPAVQVLILANANPVICYKSCYFLDALYRDRKGKPLYSIHPHYADQPVYKGVDFTKPGLNIEKLLEPVFFGT